MVKNAAYAMDNKGVINIKTAINNDNYIEVTVSDTGCGIPKDKLEVVMNPFYTTKDVEEGTGIGLTMIYNLIKNWNGTMSIQSVEGENTQVKFSIPVYSKDL